MSNSHVERGAYFALTRFGLTVRGPLAPVTENHWKEAWLTGILIYLTGYFATLPLVFRCILPLTLKVALSFLLVLAMWPAWLATLHLNSLVIRAVRAAGLWRSTPNRRAQSFLLLSTTTLVAVFGVQARNWTRWFPALWLGLVMLNAIAAIVLHIRESYDDRP